MKIADLKGILYNNHGCPLQTTLLWRFDENGNIDEYYEGVHENVIKVHGDKEVKRIEADNNVTRIVIQTN